MPTSQKYSNEGWARIKKYRLEQQKKSGMPRTVTTAAKPQERWRNSTSATQIQQSQAGTQNQSFQATQTSQRRVRGGMCPFRSAHTLQEPQKETYEAISVPVTPPVPMWSTREPQGELSPVPPDFKVPRPQTLQNDTLGGTSTPPFPLLPSTSTFEHHQLVLEHLPVATQYRDAGWRSRPENRMPPSPNRTLTTQVGQRSQNKPRLSGTQHSRQLPPGPILNQRAAPTKVPYPGAQKSSGDERPPCSLKRSIEAEQTSTKYRALEREQSSTGPSQPGQNSPSSLSLAGNGATQFRYSVGMPQETKNSNENRLAPPLLSHSSAVPRDYTSFAKYQQPYPEILRSRPLPSPIKDGDLERQKHLSGISQASQPTLPRSSAANETTHGRYSSDIYKETLYPSQHASASARYTYSTRKGTASPYSTFNETMKIENSFIGCQKPRPEALRSRVPPPPPQIPTPLPTPVLTHNTPYKNEPKVSSIRKYRPSFVGRSHPAFALTSAILSPQPAPIVGANQKFAANQEAKLLNPQKDPTYGLGSSRGGSGLAKLVSNGNEPQNIFNEGNLQRCIKTEIDYQEMRNIREGKMRQGEERVRMRGHQVQEWGGFDNPLDVDTYNFVTVPIKRALEIQEKQMVLRNNDINFGKDDMMPPSAHIHIRPEPEMVFTKQVEVPAGYLTWDSPVITLDYNNHLAGEENPPVIHSFSDTNIAGSGRMGDIRFWLSVAMRNKENEGGMEVENTLEGIYKGRMSCKVGCRRDANDGI